MLVLNILMFVAQSLLSNLWETPLPRTSHIAVRLHISANHAPVVFAQLPQDDFPFVDVRSHLSMY